MEIIGLSIKDNENAKVVFNGQAGVIQWLLHKLLGIYKTYTCQVLDDPKFENDIWSYPVKLIETHYYYFWLKLKTKYATDKI